MYSPWNTPWLPHFFLSVDVLWLSEVAVVVGHPSERIVDSSGILGGSVAAMGPISERGVETPEAETELGLTSFAAVADIPVVKGEEHSRWSKTDGLR